jgi:gamma-glutamyltranspeptidase/glutathione hydrolase
MTKLQFEKRESVLSTNGMAATSHPLVSLEAISILREGGNAVDASIAASIMLSVVEPNATGIGGDCFAIVSLNGKNPIAYNGSGIAPEKAKLDFFIKNNIKNIGLESPHSITIPGAIHAWETIHKQHGKLDFQQLFLKSINYAREGFQITQNVSENWKKNILKLCNNKNTKKIFSKNGLSYNLSEKFKNIPLSNTLEKISKKGSKEFYEGDITLDMVGSLNKVGGLHSLEDFSKQKTEAVNTISSIYKGKTLHQCPPNGPGITVLLMMKMIEKLNIENYKVDSVERFHLEAEVTKLAYSIREKNIGDPKFINLDLKNVLSEKAIDEAVKKILMNKCYNVGKLNIPAHPETVYLTVVDKDFNAVSIINSICYAFGSGITTENTGILFQNRGTNFRLEENHPNCIDGLKRPLHTIIPGMVCNNLDQPILSYGVMGGQYQSVGQTHILNNIFDYGMNPQEAYLFLELFISTMFISSNLVLVTKLKMILKKKDTKQFVTTCIMGVLKQFKLIGKKDYNRRIGSKKRWICKRFVN